MRKNCADTLVALNHSMCVYVCMYVRHCMLVYYVWMYMYERHSMTLYVNFLCMYVYYYVCIQVQHCMYIIYQYAVTLQECNNVLNTCTMVMHWPAYTMQLDKNAGREKASSEAELRREQRMQEDVKCTRKAS